MFGFVITLTYYLAFTPLPAHPVTASFPVTAPSRAACDAMAKYLAYQVPALNRPSATCRLARVGR